MPLSELLEGAVLEPVGDHWSDAEVWRVNGTARGDAFLKVAPATSWYPLREEAARLDWVAGRVPAPSWWELEADGPAGDGAVTERLLTAALPGRSLRARGDELTPARHVALHAESLRAVHDGLPTDGCPFTLTNGWLLDLSRRLHAAGRVDGVYLAEIAGGATVADAYAFLEAHPRPEHLDDVVLHGDPYAGNLIVADDGRRWGLVDWGWCGVGDRWFDVANVYVSLEGRLGGGWPDAFLDAYGIERDDAALTYYRLLDGLR